MPIQQKPFGLWPSPISPAMLGAKLRLEDAQFDPTGETIVWLEALSGKTSLWAKTGADAPRELSGGLKIGGGVGYGGGDFAVGPGFVVFASKGRLYRVELSGGLPRPITPAFGDLASPAISPDGNWVLFVHTYEKTDSLALVDSDGQHWPIQLRRGADFYMQPAWHPDSQRLAWVEWDHPQMPWDGTRLFTARLHGDKLLDVNHVYGDADTPTFQPAFSPDGRWLAFLANDGEWDTLHARNLETGEKRILLKDASLLPPAWGQGMHVFGWRGSKIVIIKNELGWHSLLEVDSAVGEPAALPVAPYTSLGQVSVSSRGEISFIGSSPKIPERLVTLEGTTLTIQRRSDSESIDPALLPEPQPIEWPAPDGTVVHGLYYPPCNPHFASDGLPPALVNIHGGPTSARGSAFNPAAAYFASRGYGYLEVNYRGSTGFGRSYMLKLRGQWGKADTEDAVGAAGALAVLGLADPQRLVIIGGSAGGYTVLNVLAHHPGVFKAGVNLYGVANLFDFIIGTHKFEERYNDSLVGILPQDAEKFKAWSPVFHADKIRDPIAVFQGAEDKVVPPQHSEQIVAALRANKVTHVYKLYEGEGHGWRKTETIVDYYETLERFLQMHVLF